MGEIVLSQVGSVIGSSMLPNGLNAFGASLSGAALGGAVGAIAGRALDASRLSPVEAPRIKALHIMESREGAGLPLVYGRIRVAGQVIWASRFTASSAVHSGGKGTLDTINYSYSVSLAVALAQGSITRIDRVWANGGLLDLRDLTWRLYTGTEDQLPDPLIEAIEGSDHAPAYRGTA